MKVKLIPAKLEDLDAVLQIQTVAFSGLLEKYQDYETSPANENYEDILFRFNQTETTYYFITADGARAGMMRVVDYKDSKTKKRISPICVLPEYSDSGCAQQAIREAEKLHGADDWCLDTILQEPKNCHLYEKLGYKRTGKTEDINDRMTIVFYEKD